MVATSATPNRIAPYLSEPHKTLPALPADPAARHALLSDAVFAAVLALQGQLVHHDPKIVQAAAGLILNFEMTRLRHGRKVAGTEHPQVLEPLPPLDPLPRPHPPAPSPKGRGGEGKVNLADPFEVYVKRVRQVLQSWEEGFPVVITWAEAREYATEMIDRERRRLAGEAVRPPSDARLVPPAHLISGGQPDALAPSCDQKGLAGTARSPV